MATSTLSETGTSTTLCDFLADFACRDPNAVFVHHRGQDWTYGEVYRHARSVAGWLRHNGLKEGDRVGVLLPNSAEYVICYFGILLAGGIVVALNPHTTPRELKHTLVHCEPTAVVSVSQCDDALEAVAGDLRNVRMFVGMDNNGEAPSGLAAHCAGIGELLEHAPTEASEFDATHSSVAQIIYTSGTTGRPKGVTLSHDNLMANCRSIVQYLDLDASDSIFVVLPFFYSYGNSLLMTHVAVGGRLILADDFVFWNRALDLMESQKATGFSGVPSTYAMLLHKSDFSKRKFPHLRYLTCAGGALAPATTERIRTRLPHVRIFPMYGQTEGSARLSTLMPEELDAKLGSIGRGIPGVRLSVLDEAGRPVRVGEVGEIVAQGDNIMVGYWKDQEATREVLRPEGLRTGDMARVDEDGYVFIVGRRNDMIKSGSYRIHPQEIEEVLLEVEGVSEVAVVGCPDKIQGEVPVAYVVLAANGPAVTEEEILDHCRTSLPRYKRPREIRLVSTLPRTTSGKVKRHEIRHELYAQADLLPTAT